MLDNLKFALKGLLVEAWTLNTTLGEISEGNEAHVVGNWRKLLLWSREGKDKWGCVKMLGRPQRFSGIYHSPTTSRTPILVMRWPEGAAGTLYQGVNHALGPVIREAGQGDVAKQRLWVWLLPDAKQVTQQRSDNMSEINSASWSASTFQEKKISLMLLHFCLPELMQNVSHGWY